MPRSLDDALADVRALLLDPTLTRAVAAGRRRGHTPSVTRAELRPVTLKGGTHLQIVTDDDYAHMRTVVGYVHRHLAQRPDGDVTHTRWRYSLMNWGHDPS